MNEPAALHELEQTVGKADGQARSHAVGIGEHEDGEHGGERHAAALRHLVELDVGEDERERDAQGGIGQHARGPLLLIARHDVEHDAEDDESGEDGPGGKADFCKFEHGKKPLS